MFFHNRKTYATVVITNDKTVVFFFSTNEYGKKKFHLFCHIRFLHNSIQYNTKIAKETCSKYEIMTRTLCDS